MKRWLDPQPRLWPGDGKLYLCGHKYESSQTYRGIPFVKGLAYEGRPVTSEMINLIKAAGQLVVWWEWEADAVVEWFDEGPRAYVKEADKPKADKSKAKKPRWR